MKILRVSIIVPLLALFSWVNALNSSIGYAPSQVACDENIRLVRQASELSQNETDWLKKRDSYTREALQSFLERATSNFSDNSLVSTLFGSDNDNVPRVAVACSGGGYRAMLSGAGMVAAMDNRTDGANEHGLGGLLQSTTYLAGLSGGSWLVGTLALNNWTSVQSILDNMSLNNSIWDITYSIASPGGPNTTVSNETWSHIIEAVNSKEEAGFNISLADYWGRALSYDFFPSLPEGGVSYAWSSLRDTDVFKNGEMPFPISVADFRKPNTVISSANSTIFEFNPFEMGSWDDSLDAFADVKYLGTEAFNGVPVNKGQCVEGFDNAGFVVGTSSTLFSPSMSSVVGLLLNGGAVASIFEKAIGNDSNDVAIYAPNPFKGINSTKESTVSQYHDDDYLYLVDGGEDSQTIPIAPLLQKDRELDVIFALDNSADTVTGWPAGVGLVSTYERQFGPQGADISFPHVPDEETFNQLGLNQQPTFFGCDANNLTDLNHIPPLVVYIPNAYYSFKSNQSTLKMSYTETERLKMIQNGFEVATRGNLTQDTGFAGCIACAIVRRKQENMNATLPAECEKCFNEYCWRGSVSFSNGSLPINASSLVTSSAHVTSGSTSTLAPSQDAIQSSSPVVTATSAISSLAVQNSGWTVKGNPFGCKTVITILCVLFIVGSTI